MPVYELQFTLQGEEVKNVEILDRFEEEEGLEQALVDAELRNDFRASLAYWKQRHAKGIPRREMRPLRHKGGFYPIAFLAWVKPILLARQAAKLSVSIARQLSESIESLAPPADAAKTATLDELPWQLPRPKTDVLQSSSFPCTQEQFLRWSRA